MTSGIEHEHLAFKALSQADLDPLKLCLKSLVRLSYRTVYKAWLVVEPLRNHHRNMRHRCVPVCCAPCWVLFIEEI